MMSIFSQSLKFASRHKVLTGILVLALIFGGYRGYQSIFSNEGAVRYVFARAQKGTLIVSISGSGQVSALNHLDIKPKVSGDIVYVGVKNGQAVKAGDLIAQLDAGDAQKAVRDAETNLESAKLSLEKLKKPADSLSVLQAENSLAQAKESKQKAEDNLEKAYEDGFNTVANAFLDLPSIMAGMEDMLFDSNLTAHQGGQWNIDWYANTASVWDKSGGPERQKDEVYNGYQNARKKYDRSFENYRAVSRNSDEEIVEALILETYYTTKIIAEAVKTTNNYIDFTEDLMEQNDSPVPPAVADHQSDLDSYTGTTNDHLIKLLAIKRTIEDSKDAITNARRTIAEKTEALADLASGADALDIQSAELAARQRENALADAKENLADYSVRAPFDGVVAAVGAKKGDSVSSAAVLAALITRQKLAEISLNEIDVAQVKIGQKVELTFDALPELSIGGQVAEIDTVGTVSQGVVTYNVKIAFDPVRSSSASGSEGTRGSVASAASNGIDARDERVKPGMSVSAAIVTDSKPDVLLVPNSAVKSESREIYVEMPNQADMDSAASARVSGAVLQEPLRRKTIEIGLSNDEVTEVAGGLREGDLVVTRVIQSGGGQIQPQSGGAGFPFQGGRGGGGSRGGGGAGGLFGH